MKMPYLAHLYDSEKKYKELRSRIANAEGDIAELEADKSEGVGIVGVGEAILYFGTVSGNAGEIKVIEPTEIPKSSAFTFDGKMLSAPFENGFGAVLPYEPVTFVRYNLDGTKKLYTITYKVGFAEGYVYADSASIEFHETLSSATVSLYHTFLLYKK